MLERLGLAIARHAIVTIVIWVIAVSGAVALAVGGVLGESLYDRVSSGAPSIPGSQSAEGDEILAATSTSGQQIMMNVSQLDALAPNVAEAVSAGAAKLVDLDAVASVTEPTALLQTDPASEPALALTAKKKDGFLIIVSLRPDLDEIQLAAAHEQVEDELHAIARSVEKVAPTSKGIVSSSSLIVEEIVGQSERDLITGEAIALTLSLLVMVIIFGGFLAAAIPMIGAVASIAGGFLTMLGISYVLNLDSPVVNVITVLGIGLAIDYGILIVSRFREELHIQLATFGTTPVPDGPRFRVRDPLVIDALSMTLARAGRTVIFSSTIVAISMSSLMIFAPGILKAVGASALVVVIITLLTALTLVPAVLALTGRRLDRESLLQRIPRIGSTLAKIGDAAPETGFFSRLAAWVQRFPWLVMIATIAILLLLASPLLGLQMRNSTVELLPVGSTQREFVDTVHQEYPAISAAPIRVVAETTVAEAEQLAAQIAKIDHVTAVSPPAPRETYSVLEVRIDSSDVSGQHAHQVVAAIRALPTEYSTWTSGQAAGEIDFTEALLERAPCAIAFVVLAGFALLFLMTGSILIPIKAIIANALSLGAALGVLVWTFQDGHLEGLIGFTSAGGVESYIVVLVLAFGFGIATDYEVIMLSRVKELHDEGYSTNESVRYGLQRSGRIITSAALIIILVFVSFMAGDLLVIKQAGFALAMAVLIDATLVRCLLVPATMTILNEWNWWAPTPLRRLHAKLMPEPAQAPGPQHLP